MRTELMPKQIDSYREQGFLMVSDFLGTPQDGLLPELLQVRATELQRAAG
jgi:hypothetical protein